ncbi:ATP-binding protein [Beijerinckia sp. L45]|uniref:ATP-binding protein n=1 Tax=Beijerinckia sp. L45 TaxID=1641855 RepID=UPI00131B4BE0|nr:ATP-binding protein [Beijerinckia sp. L45]
MRLALWPRGLIGRVGLVLVAAILLEVIGSVVVFEQAEILSGDQIQAWRIAEELVTSMRVFDVTPQPQRPVVGRSMSSRELTIDWRDTRDNRPEGAGTQTRILREAIIAHEPGLADLDLRLQVQAAAVGKALDGSLRLPDGTFLRFHAPNLETPVPALYAQLGSVLILSVCVLVAALLLVRTLASPLALLARATDAIGHGAPVLLDVHGPREVRRVARAFNAMQDRIARLITGRTEALAAVSHDLRTPIARLRLRAGFLADADDREAIEADLAEMEAMVNDLLDHLGGEDDPEKPRRTDLVTLLTTLVEDASDAGHIATYSGPDRLILDLRPRGLKRGLSNIVNNALAYGDTARVSLTRTASAVCIAIDDDGPGIPSADVDAVFEPFRRLEGSRNRSTGGTGLGLTIARQAVQREGGTITLVNRPEGGLSVRVSLPA